MFDARFSIRTAEGYHKPKSTVLFVSLKAKVVPGSAP